MALQIAAAASDFQKAQTGHAPLGTTVVVSDETLVITLHGALSEAERALTRSPEGAPKVQEFHRNLFNSSAHVLRERIGRITGVEVREAAAEIETTSGTVIHAFTTGAIIQVFLLNEKMSERD
jgi:uncharacterized protein YbcI